jgi:8-oxo-dGTP diphosphatase
MLHRVKKEHDINRDKWIGVGGHFEAQESPEDCLLREVREETGLILNAWKLRGVISFIYGGNDGEYMFVYTADSFTGTLTDCDEGELEWVEKAKVYELPLWEGDRIFLRLLETERPFFSLKLLYEGDKLLEAVLDGRKL